MQGFVWAIKMRYEAEGSIMHGGIHTILKDKVKRETIRLKDGDRVVRVSGRASPFNINRFTLYTAKGKKYGPYGDRRSEESVDFDVRAPDGQVKKKQQQFPIDFNCVQYVAGLLPFYASEGCLTSTC